MMAVFPATNGQSIKLEALDADAVSGGDRVVIVSLDLGASTGTVESWVLAEAWQAFITSLVTLERTRCGTARLKSISPGELELEFHDVNARGHIGVRGQIALSYLGDGATWMLGFDALRLDAEYFGAAVASLAKQTAWNDAPARRTDR